MGALTCRLASMMKAHWNTWAIGSKVSAANIQGTPTVTPIVSKALISRWGGGGGNHDRVERFYKTVGINVEMKVYQNTR